MDGKANSSKLRNIIAALVIAAAIGAGGYLVGKGDAPPAAPVAEIEVESAKPAAPAVVDVALGRADIIRLANEAADAASGGPAIVDPLDGRRFVVRIPIGCPASGSGNSGGPASYSVDDGVLRISIQPQDWTTLPWVESQLARREVVAAQGFWIPRPWTRSETCPQAMQVPAQPEPATEPSKSETTVGPGAPVEPAQPATAVVAASGLGIARLFDSESSRVGQRQGRPLQATIPVEPDDPGAGKGLTMVLTGRVARWPGGNETVLCNAAQPFERPTCLVGAELDSISIEHSGSGERLAEWRF